MRGRGSNPAQIVFYYLPLHKMISFRTNVRENNILEKACIIVLVARLQFFHFMLITLSIPQFYVSFMVETWRIVRLKENTLYHSPAPCATRTSEATGSGLMQALRGKGCQKHRTGGPIE